MFVAMISFVAALPWSCVPVDVLLLCSSVNPKLLAKSPMHEAHALLLAHNTMH
jgi:hypothetical protein